MERRVEAQHLGQHGAGSAADIDYAPHLSPTLGNLELGAGATVSRRTDQVVKLGRDPGVRLKVVPERKAEDVGIARPAGADEGEQAAPGVSHAAAETVQVEPNMHPRVEQTPRRVVKREMPRRRLLKHASTNQV